MAWTRRQQIILAYVPKVSSLFSLFGSVWILVEVLSDNNRQMPKRRHPYHRLLLGMSIYDILESVWNFASTWAIPAGTEGVWQPRGTTASCTAQGFFLTLSVAVPIYNAFLSLYYVMVINYGMKDMKIAERAEPLMHLVAFSWAFFTALYSAVTGLINNSNLWCWIAPLPGDCLDSRRYGSDNEHPCTRGDNAWIYRWAFYFAPLWFCIFFATVCTLMVYIKVQKYDRVTLKYRRPDLSFSFKASKSPQDHAGAKQPMQSGDFEMEDEDENEDVREVRFALAAAQSDPKNGQNEPEQSSQASSDQPWWNPCGLFRRWQRHRQMFREDHPRTYEVFQQSLWYLGVFYITHVWSTTNRTIQMINNGDTYYGLIVIHSFFDPLQGFLNYLVYQRPRYLRIRAAKPELNTWQAMGKALTFSRFGGAELSNRSITRSSALRSSSRRNNSSLRVSRSSGPRVSESSENRNSDVVIERGSMVSVDERELAIIAEETSKDFLESPAPSLRMNKAPPVSNETSTIDESRDEE